MSRLLDIIVPHYNESWSVVKPFFDVIAAQRGVDFNKFRIFLVHNGDLDPFPSEYFQDNPAQIEQIVAWKKGVSHARNFGMYYADSEWVCFCDCDDCYTSIFSLKMILSILENPETDKFNMIWAPFYMHQGDKLVVSDKPNNTFVHNKYYRLSYLREKKLAFNENLTMSEDSAFNTVFAMETNPNTIGRLNYREPLYCWCRRPGSVTMDPAKWISNAEGHFERNLYIFQEYTIRKRPYRERLVARTITDAYSMLTRQGFKGNTGPILARLSEFYRANMLEYEMVSKEDLKVALDASDRDCCATEKDIAERMPLDQWIRVNLE